MTPINMTEDRIASAAGAAGAGFRLSLILNAVRMKMQNADAEIQNISRGVSDFSLMLKQVARTMQEGGVAPTPLAVETLFDIKDHSEHIFEEIKNMTELAQIRDESGNLTEIGISQRIVWCFKQQKVPYMLGQLDYLKLNLAIMLQILQLAKIIAPTKPRVSDKFMMQERAEIQNMIVLQHWSFEELRNLYNAANDDTRRDSVASVGEDPPPKYDDQPPDEVRLAITAPPRPPKENESSQAMVQYKEQPLQQLDESLHQALSKENQTLSAQVPDIVNHLLREWTIPQYPPQAEHPGARAITNGVGHYRSRRYGAHVSDEEEDTTESDYDDSDDQPRGKYLEGPKPNAVKKKLRFKEQQAKVESDSDEENHRPRRSTDGRHILRNANESSSDSELSSSPAATRHHRSHRSHKQSSSGSSFEHPSHTSYDRKRRPYAGAPSGPRNSPPEKEAIRPPPGSRGMAHSPRQGHVPIQTQGWQGHPPQGHPPNPNLRPPAPQHYYTSPGAPQRSNQGGPYIPQQYQPGIYSPAASPTMQKGSFFPHQQGRPPGPAQGPPPAHIPRDSRSARTKHDRSNRSSYESNGSHRDRVSERGGRDKKDASRNIKKGIGIGAAAAGLMELLSGLDGI